MSNLLHQTKAHILNNKKVRIEDIVYIGNPFTRAYIESWEEFEKVADFEYDSGFGCQEIMPGLRIVFKDGSFMSRWEYDGSEGWGYEPVIDYSLCKESKISILN